MKKSILILGLLIQVMFSMAQNRGIQGVVYDKDTNEPLPGATVEIKTLNQATATNKNGRYLITPIPAGDYTVKVSYIGYASQQKQITINNKVATLHFQLKQIPDLLNEVVVTGTGTTHNIRSAPVMTEVIGAKFLSLYAGQSLEEILAGISPSFDYNENIMGSNIQMNGLGNSYILILVNGKRLHGDVGGQNNLSLINPADIAKIEIVKGASSSLYGSDAIAGVINIITKKTSGDLEIHNTSRVASYSGLQQSNKMVFSVGKLKSTTDFNWKHSDGWQNTNIEWYRKKIRPNSVTKTVNRFTDFKIKQSFDYRIGKNTTANASAFIYQKKIYRPVGEPQYSTYGLMYKSQSYALDIKHQLSNKSNLFFNSSYDITKYYHNYTRWTIEQHILEDGTILHPIYYNGDEIMQNRQQRMLMQLKGVFELNQSHKISSGIEFRNDFLYAKYRMYGGEKSVYTLASYLQDEYNISKNLNLTGGIRLINHEHFGWKATPKISALYKWNKVNLRATWSQGFKTPTTKQLYYHYKRTMMGKYRLYLGNTDLKPQTSNYYSMSVELNTGRFSGSVTPYYNKLKNRITLIEIPTSYNDKMQDVDKTLEYQNIEDATIKGIDVMLRYQLTPSLTISGGYSYTNARGHFLNDDDIIESIHIDGTSKHHANVSALWKHKWKKYKLGIALFGKGQTKRYYRYYGDADGYMLWRLNTTHQILSKSKWQFKFQAGIDNLFNYKETKPYGYNYGTKTPGRTIYLSININFKRK